MSEYMLRGPAVPYSLDHRGMVSCIRVDDAIRQDPCQRGQCCIISNKAGAEDQSGGFVVQLSDFSFKLLGHLGVSCDVASAAGSGAVGADGADGRVLHRGVARGAEVVVGAPHGDAPVVAALQRARVRALGRQPRHLTEHAVRVVLLLGADLLVEELLVRIGGAAARVDVFGHLLRCLGHDRVLLDEGALGLIVAERAEPARQAWAVTPVLLQQAAPVVSHVRRTQRLQERTRHFYVIDDTKTLATLEIVLLIYLFERMKGKRWLSL